MVIRGDVVLLDVLENLERLSFLNLDCTQDIVESAFLFLHFIELLKLD